mmetsp:Transcript_11769/g.18863  ORF Transcript_11769/g.18863 Transcript_11769/m.18863 type:complete len:429 (+) Transcript_11769:2-1288(+)
MAASLQCRHRSVIGTQSKAAARETARVILGAADEDAVVFGANATVLLASLAQRYVQQKLLCATDEVVISTENHKANFDPWIAAALQVGATVKLWTPSLMQQPQNLPSTSNYQRSASLHELITPQTRIVAIPHASNILGNLEPVAFLSGIIKSRSRGRAHIVVDGVAAVPHIFPGFNESLGNIDWYVVSMHKLFGPHLGVLVGRRGQAMEQLSVATQESFLSSLESGTVNIEGCAGVVGLGVYFRSLARFYHTSTNGRDDIKLQLRTSLTGENVVEEPGHRTLITSGDVVSLDDVKLAYSMIRRVEIRLTNFLIQGLGRSQFVRILGCPLSNSSLPCHEEQSTLLVRLPTVSFLHDTISSQEIYRFCKDRGIICRHGLFLCTEFFAADFGLENNPDGLLRVSLSHYNTVEEISELFNVLDSIPGWHGRD